ncbi:hypothetical protein [Streptomyces sp. NPDC003036]|uniref:hypothetical protein n=1 Tax=Streptomyces sp. NPDC003036 TaxID=3154442 RepID=UPI0033A76FE4
MKIRTRLAAAACLLLPVLAGCAATEGPGGRASAGPPPADPTTLLVEADAHGYITFDTEREVLQGFRSDGTHAWKHSGHFPSDIQCLTRCPDAVISAAVTENPKQKKSAAIWKQGIRTSVKEFEAARLDVHWSSGPDDWVATDGERVTWSAGGEEQSLTGGLKDAMGVQSADGGSLAVSVATGSDAAPRWSAYLFDVGGRHAGPPRLVADHLPGALGCLDRAGDRAATIGERPALFTLGTGRKVRELGDFSSECAMSRTTTVVGAYAVGKSEQDAQAVRVTANTGDRTAEAVTSSGGGLGASGDCGVFLSEGRISTMSPTGQPSSSEIRATGLRVLPDGLTYALGPDGKVTRHRAAGTGSACAVT